LGGATWEAYKEKKAKKKAEQSCKFEFDNKRTRVYESFLWYIVIKGLIS
jgi:hypothetical protein